MLHCGTFKVKLLLKRRSAVYLKLFHCLLGRGEPHAISIPVEHCVVLPNEYISQDPEGSCRRWDIHGRKA